MKKGYLSDYFTAVASKKLSKVEIIDVCSNQHEFNGVSDLKRLFGNDSASKKIIPTTFLYLSDYDEDYIQSEGRMTWYDSRKEHPTRSEFRLYYPYNAPMAHASEGDELIIAQKTDNTALAIICENGSTISSQLKWMFGFPNELHSGTFSVREDLVEDQDRLSYVSKIILDLIGIDTEDGNEAYLDELQEKFKEFPSTREFSEYARGTLNIDPLNDPDKTLMLWVEREDILFRTLEKHLIDDMLEKWSRNIPKTDEFIAFSLSVQNRRKSRAGSALENHMEALLISYDLAYTRGGTTENKFKPDFIFPSIEKYHDPTFPESSLTMLGAKTTCKDRWRQVLSEAERIKNKHLLTIQPAISENQLEQMRCSNLQLVIPKGIHETYPENERKWLMSIEEFIDYIQAKQ